MKHLMKLLLFRARDDMSVVSYLSENVVNGNYGFDTQIVIIMMEWTEISNFNTI